MFFDVCDSSPFMYSVVMLYCQDSPANFSSMMVSLGAVTFNLATFSLKTLNIALYTFHFVSHLIKLMIR